MKHVTAGPCPECGRDYYLVIFPKDEASSLGDFREHHLDEPCALFQAVTFDATRDEIA
jgi:hypothetical protein